jgi:hypothetical protein
MFHGGVSMTTATLGSNDPEIGARRVVGDEEYLFVYNTGNSTVAPGHAVICSGTSGYSVTVSSTSGSDLAVGVCKHASIVTAAYGWVVTRGFVDIEMGANYSAAIGSLLTLAGDGTHDIVSGFTGTLAPYAKAQSAIASGASGQAYVRC